MRAGWRGRGLFRRGLLQPCARPCCTDRDRTAVCSCGAPPPREAAGDVGDDLGVFIDALTFGVVVAAQRAGVFGPVVVLGEGFEEGAAGFGRECHGRGGCGAVVDGVPAHRAVFTKVEDARRLVGGVVDDGDLDAGDPGERLVDVGTDHAAPPGVVVMTAMRSWRAWSSVKPASIQVRNASCWSVAAAASSVIGD